MTNVTELCSCKSLSSCGVTPQAEFSGVREARGGQVTVGTFPRLQGFISQVETKGKGDVRDSGTLGDHQP